MKAFSIAIVKLLAFAGIAMCAIPSLAQDMVPGSFHWYVPEHEKYGGRTMFYSQPSFQSAVIQVARTQRFKVLGATKGWAVIQFDVVGKAYIHLRVLHHLIYNPSATDTWYEFQRASVFPEEPASIEARLKPQPITPPPSAVDSKTPVWKRYKDAWALKPARPATSANPEEAAAEPVQPTSRPGASAKPRSKHPMLPPIGSEPPQEATKSDKPEEDAEAAPSR